MAHYWPSDDFFYHGTTVYGDYLSAYIKTAFWLSKSIAHPTTGSYTSTMSAADLTDLYDTGPAGGTALATPSADHAGYLWRARESASPVIVSLGFSVARLTGAAHTETQALSCVMVAARVNGGTYTGASHKLEDVQSGYFFGLLNDTTRGACWYLLRLNAGTVTVLDSEAFSGGVLTSAITPFNSNAIELELTASGADVRLRGRYTGADATIGTVEVFDYTDSSGSKLTGAGRFGFCINGKRTITGGIVAAQVSHFSIVQSGVTYLRDEWERAYRQSGTLSSDTVGSVNYTGRSMLSAFAGDFHCVASFDKKLRRYTTDGLLAIDPVAEPVGSGTGAGGFIVSARKASDKRSQHRRLHLSFSTSQYDGSASASVPSNYRMAGIFVRGSTTQAPSSSFVLSLGYQAVIVRDDGGGAATCYLYRWRGGVPTKLAEVDVSAEVPADTDVALEVSCWNQEDSAGDNIGPTVIQVYIDTVQLVLVDTVGVPGVSVNAAGTVVDGSNERTIEGPLEGPFVWLNTGDQTILLGKFEELTLTNSLYGDDVDQASISIDDEAADYSGLTFTIPYEWPVEEVDYDESDVARFESGHVRSGLRHTRGRKVWRVGARAIDDDARDDLLTFWDAHGAKVAFNFVPPDESVAVRAHFLSPELGTRFADKGVHSFNIDIEELVDL